MRIAHTYNNVNGQPHTQFDSSWAIIPNKYQHFSACLITILDYGMNEWTHLT